MQKLVTLQLVNRSTIRGPERDRTADLLNANQALSQLSYRPKRVRESVERLFKEQSRVIHVPRSTFH